MYKNIVLLMILLFSFQLVGCTAFKHEIIAYHNIAEQKIYKYALLRLDDQNSLAHKSYEQQIRAELNKRGYVEVPIQEAEIGISVFYQMGGSSTQVGSMPTYGQTGSTSSYNPVTGMTTYTPTYGVTGSQTYSYNVHTRLLKMDFIDLKKSNDKNIEYLYQVSVVSEGSSANIERVVPQMIEAVFKDFPGESGKSRKMTTYEE